VSEASNNNLVNLHSVTALQDVAVREDVRLVPLAETDTRDILVAIEHDPSIRERVTVASRMLDEPSIVREVDSYRADPGLIRYGIRKDNKVIGLISLWRDEGFFGTEPQNDDYGFGYFLDPNYRGAGIVTSSIASLIQVLSADLYVRQFVAFCEENNQESLAVLSKLGFKPTGDTFREPTHGWLEQKYTKAAIVNG
jgi:RimJ/RimL family protein N-acetyltransferase